MPQTNRFRVVLSSRTTRQYSFSHAVHQPGFSMPYSAPENYTPQPHYDSKNDVFSLGVIMYELFFDKYPFFLHDEDLRR